MVRVVISKAGRDVGKLMALVGETEQGMLLCDGKERPIERPKLKNKKHVVLTNFELEQNDLKSNKSLRKALYKISNHSEEELICQKKI